ncbi:thioredoxin family protein [Ectothiorhodospiraceae bacterium WFHF3C12]|nr:thioredoxin family protein [Ectothiorhodospiraceae bacterium WFHF3C12]
MARTESSMRPLGTPAPAFRLPDAEGREWSLADFGDARALVVAFICNHCPFVRHILPALADYARELAGRGGALVAINANDVEAYPQDAPEHMAALMAHYGHPFVYLFDASQSTARAYGAACTPDFFLFDAQRRLAYRGRFDGSSPGNDVPADGAALRAATDAVLAGEAVPGDQVPSIGCNIKWRPGNAPSGA